MKIGDLVRYTPKNKGDLGGVALVVEPNKRNGGWVIRWIDDGTEDYTCVFLPGELEVISESR